MGCNLRKLTEALKTRFTKTLPKSYCLQQLALLKQEKPKSVHDFEDKIKVLNDKLILKTGNESGDRFVKEEANKGAMNIFLTVLRRII